MAMDASGNQRGEKKPVATKLRDFFSLMMQAKAIEKDTATLVQSLRDQPTNAHTYLLDENLAVNLGNVREIFSGSDDIRIREFVMTAFKRKAAIVFIEGMVDQNLISQHIVQNLTLPPLTGRAINAPFTMDDLKSSLLTAPSITEVVEMEQAIDRVLDGDTALFVDGISTVMMIATRKLESRAISAPKIEAGLRGPQDSFTEELDVNITLLRRRIKNPNLVVKRSEIGVRSKTGIAVVYFRGIANPNLVCKVEQRLQKIKVDSPTSKANIENLIKDHPLSPFPTVLATERPDRLTTELMQGKVAILQDGTPFCLVAPTVLTDFFVNTDDYYDSWAIGAFIRFTRYITAILALISPALYIAITTFHTEFVSTPLTITLSTARQGIPLPAFLEALVMVGFLEMMQEAGLRLPKPIGPAVSIVGGLIISDSAARAGIVSLSVIIVISLTAVATFTLANYRIGLPLRVLRIPLMIAAASFGLFGLQLGILAIMIHLSTLESFGEPYLASLIPCATPRLHDLRDALIVAPQSVMQKRPAYLETADTQRQDPEQ